MPGGVDPTFGSRLADAFVSAGLASLLVTALYIFRGAAESPEQFAAVSAAGYVLSCAGVYLVPRYLLDAFVSGVFSGQYLAWVAVFVLPLLAVQGGIPAYLYAEREYVSALAGLVAATALTFWVLLSTGGESDVLVVYPFVLFPVAAGIVAASIAADVAVRTVSGAVGA